MVSVRTVCAANPIRSAGVSGADANHLISNGVNINSSLLGDQVEDKLGRGNF